MKEFVEDIFEDMINEIHTTKPCLVTAVNYIENTIDAKILTKTRLSDEIQEEFPDLYDVPLMVLSAGAGNSRITLPVKIGDHVVVLMSDRSYSNLISETLGTVPVDCDEFKTHDLFPILAIPCFFTAKTAKPIDPNNIVIENGSTEISIEPNGKVVVNALNTEITGNLDITAILKAGGINMNTHTHPIVWTDPAGSGTSGPPIIA